MPLFETRGTRTLYDERSVPDLLRDLKADTTTLLRQEVELAKQEMAGKAKSWGKNAAFVVVGGLVAYTGLLFLLLGLVALLYLALWGAGLPQGTSLWLGALLVGVVIGAIGAGLILKGYSVLKRESVVPERTVDSLKEEAAWLKRKLS